MLDAYCGDRAQRRVVGLRRPREVRGLASAESLRAQAGARERELDLIGLRAGRDRGRRPERRRTAELGADGSGCATRRAGRRPRTAPSALAPTVRGGPPSCSRPPRRRSRRRRARPRLGVARRSGCDAALRGGGHRCRAAGLPGSGDDATTPGRLEQVRGASRRCSRGSRASTAARSRSARPRTNAAASAETELRARRRRAGAPPRGSAAGQWRSATGSPTADPGPACKVASKLAAAVSAAWPSWRWQTRASR